MLTLLDRLLADQRVAAPSALRAKQRAMLERIRTRCSAGRLDARSASAGLRRACRTEDARGEHRAAHAKYERLLDARRALPPMPTAVVHPCDEAVARRRDRRRQARPDRADPGRAARRASARPRARPSVDISAYPIVDAPHSHAAAAKAVELVREGQAEALMKGSLHTDELMGAVVAREGGLRTARRISHCFVMDVPELRRRR